MAHDAATRNGEAVDLRPSEADAWPPKVVVHGAWGRTLPAPKPREKEESILTSWLMGLLGRPHCGTLDERGKAPARR